jgi:drug/metabolite transporter (DMT)-like permease
MNSKIDKTAMALAVAFIIALVISTLSRFDAFTGIPSGYMIAYWTMGLVTIIVRIGCGWWLYQKAKPKQQYPWLWCLLGAVFGLVTVATYYIVEVHKKLSVPDENSEET